MKIVKAGKLPILVGKCKVCGCEVETEYNREWVSWFSNGNSSFPHYNCPTEGCGARIDLWKKNQS